MTDDGNNTSGDTADGDGIYSVKLAVQFMGSNESRCYTVVVGAAEAAPGTTVIDLGNAVTVTSFAAQCSDVPVDFECSANCREPYAYGPGRISRCLGGDVWTGPTGFCEPWVCTSDPFPQQGLPVTCDRKGQAGYAPGALCTAPCPQGRR
uniref:Sushi domain-containing protein n=1 Tax=Tetradesmus obliquus TaxID=3088 RepID=A0A383VCA7_TETOB|eukprot:jgi/Sobl393_1/12456/SZX62570.1